ncbi:MAG TPA: DUF1501 domain-containing protein [Phycisphaerae bacterium]|jgi:hypothetical protein|nr:DUF1501 domain-containing protein [Phycisphaerae bacterium]HOJ54870.1 DUF1501 domain-containing protein [Phycisphaerae bacterium]HOL26056.1 DUF1501 domain-containing protein [Phycisphaerae bacterium]HPP21510.1 DUF1501 domain-containing protein [Phycisphaerae bacterium]HPU31514.1 DUF1501 domain-containing protein [Phycisphaerae bacterium]
MKRIMQETSGDGAFQGGQPTRRELLRAGAAGAVGLALAGGSQVEASKVAGTVSGPGTWQRPNAQSVILVFLEGGLSQVDSFDPKPEAPREIRGEFGAIRTSADGIRICELWPEVARVAHRMAFIRSMSHAESAHERGLKQMLDGLMAITGTAVDDGSFALRGLPLSEGISRTAGCSRAVRASAGIKPEPASIRDTYGRTPFGQRMLLARRLVEAGRPFVAVRHGGWDMHADVHAGMRAAVPAVDRAVAALIRDLAQRGLLDSTLVMISTEFGRSPRLNRDGGRDHWPKAFSVALAGGGIRGGEVIGASSADGMEPRDTPVSPADLVASVCKRLGIEDTTTLGIAHNGRPIAGLA